MAKKFLSKRLADQINMTNLSRAVSYAKEFGVGTAAKKVFQKFYYVMRNREGENIISQKKYLRWIEKNEPTTAELEKQRTEKFKAQPKISIAVPTFNTPLNFLKPMVESVLGQTYVNWELCIADGSTNEATKQYIGELPKRDKRIKVTFLDKNYGIAGNTNKAIELSSGEYLALLDHDDTLAPFALYEVARLINEDLEADVIYSDEDKLTFDGKLRANPHFKPDWSPDNLLSYNYITHLLVTKMSLLQSVGLIRGGFEGAQDFDLVLRLTEKAKRIAHIPKVLYHWREHDNSTAKNTEAKTYVTFSTQKAVADALHRRGIDGRVFGGPFFGSARVVYALKDKPLVSIIIPSKDHFETISTCIHSITGRTTYPSYEIIIADTGSTDQKTLEFYKYLDSQNNIKVVNWDKPFNFSAVNNFAAKSAKGDYLLFLNNDVEIQTAEWIESMLEFAQRNDVGAVGAKLFYPDFTIQHGGVFLGIGGVAGHSHKSFPRESDGYYGRLSLPNNLSAVTAACVMVPVKIFQEIGGFDEGYPLAFNDIDLCLKIRRKGYLIVWTPYAQLTHYESKTRGYEDTPEKQQRFKMEIDRFVEKWGSWLEKGDPYYNPNLTLTREDFSIKD